MERKKSEIFILNKDKSQNIIYNKHQSLGSTDNFTSE